MSEKYSQSHTEAHLGTLRQETSLESSATPASPDAPLDLAAFSEEFLEDVAEGMAHAAWVVEHHVSDPNAARRCWECERRYPCPSVELAALAVLTARRLERAEAALAELQEAISFGPWGQKSDAAILLRWAEDMERKYGGERAVTRWLRKVSAALATPAPGEGTNG